MSKDDQTIGEFVNEVLAELIPESLVAYQQLVHERFIFTLKWTPAVLSDHWKLLDFELVVPITPETVSMPPVVVELWRRGGQLIYRELVSGQATVDPEAGSRFGMTPIVFPETSDLEVRVTLAEPAETVVLPVPRLVIREAPGSTGKASDAER